MACAVYGHPSVEGAAEGDSGAGSARKGSCAVQQRRPFTAFAATSSLRITRALCATCLLLPLAVLRAGLLVLCLAAGVLCRFLVKSRAGEFLGWGGAAFLQLYPHICQGSMYDTQVGQRGWGVKRLGAEVQNSCCCCCCWWCCC